MVRSSSHLQGKMRQKLGEAPGEGRGGPIVHGSAGERGRNETCLAAKKERQRTCSKA